MMRSLTAVALAAMVLTLAGPALAVEQATVSQDSSVGVTYQGTSGVDDVTITESPGVVRLTQVGLVPGAGCTTVVTDVECPLTPNTAKFSLGAGNDKFNASGTYVSTFIYAEAGNDTITGGSGYDTIEATDFAVDIIDCGPGEDRVYADAIDTLIGCEAVHFPPPSPPGAPPTYLKVGSPVAKSWKLLGSLTQVAKLKVTRVPAGGTVLVKCSKKNCPFKQKTAKVDANGSAPLTAFFKKRKLKPGVVIEVRITHPSMIGKVVRYTVRKGKVPSVKNLCMAPWDTRPTDC